MQNKIVAVVAVVMVALGASATYGWLALAPQPQQTVTRLNVGNLLFMQVGASLYFADEVTAQTVVPSNGYSYFTNSSITFYGVKFQSVCPTSIIGCPGASNSTGATSVGIPGTFTKVTISFPDAKRETVTGGVAYQVFATYVTNHSGPRAGVAFEYISLTKTYRVFLLVTPYSLPQIGA
ncbi:MAG TPA: hypothetical protein VKF15_00755 [Nitrososphaerales archaeon]|nr:hypothetical protein [Nitrososphaerales archaeon]